MAVGLLDGRPRGRADVREDKPGGDMAGQLAQVAIVPGGLDAVEDGRCLLRAIPADAEAVAVRLLRAELRMKTLDDQGVLGLVQELLEQDGRARICEPATHESPSRRGFRPFRLTASACRRHHPGRVNGTA